MNALITLRFPEQRSFSPERLVRPLSYGLPVYADVRYPPTDVDSFAEEHPDVQVEFRKVCLPQTAMIQALQSGSVTVVWNDTIWKVQGSEQEADYSLTLTCEREQAYSPPEREPVAIGTETATIGDDTPVLKGGA